MTILGGSCIKSNCMIYEELKYNRLHTMAIIIDINIQDVYRIIGQYPDSVILISIL